MRTKLISATIVILIFTIHISGCGNSDCPSQASTDQMIFGIESDKALILHNGHCAWDDNMTHVAEQFVDAGFQVYRAEMPPLPHTEKTDFFSHLDELTDELSSQGKEIYMVGISGGGWTTTMYSAMNPDIIKSVSVAGDLPLEIRDDDNMDFEQANPPIEYLKAYRLSEERLLHIYNHYDPCCFSGIDESMDIGTPFVVDYSHSQHMISAWAVDYILGEVFE